MSKGKVIALSILAAILLLVAGFSIYSIIVDGMMKNRRSIEYNDTTYYMKDNMYNLLVLGIDKDGIIENETGKVGDNGQADVVGVVSIDNESNEVRIIAVPRDTIVAVDESGGSGSDNFVKEEQLCLQYAYAHSSTEGAELVKVKVEELLGVDIDNYIALSWGGVEDIVDFIGGVDITFSRDYVIFSKIDDTVEPHWSYFKAGDTQHMTPKQAMDFLQYRNTDIDYTNLDRMDRQKDFLSSFIGKAKAIIKDDYSSVIDFSKVMSPYMTTDIQPTKYFELAKMAMSVHFTSEDIISVPGESVHWGTHDGYLADNDELLKLVLPIFYKMNGD